jgi:hypothetical protein
LWQQLSTVDIKKQTLAVELKVGISLSTTDCVLDSSSKFNSSKYCPDLQLNVTLWQLLSTMDIKKQTLAVELKVGISLSTTDCVLDSSSKFNSSKYCPDLQLNVTLWQQLSTVNIKKQTIEVEFNVGISLSTTNCVFSILHCGNTIQQWKSKN